MKKAIALSFAQRAGGRCEPEEERTKSTFGAGGDEPRGAPLTAQSSGRQTGNLGGNADTFRPMKLGGGVFFMMLGIAGQAW